MNRPTITLCAIMRDEIKNIRPLIESVHGCFDEIHLTDTGSVDGTREWAVNNAAKVAGCPVKVKDFTWVNDFAKARNFSMNEVKTDYVMWLDLDDVLSSREEFIRWRDNVMELADFWLATYNYAYSGDRPICSFLRERVIKTSKKFSWQYFIHEGMIADEQVAAQVAMNWTVNHKRTEEDYKQDYERNVSMLEERSKLEELPPRLQWYFGKELHDKGRYAESYVWLNKIIDSPKLELHDRVLCHEYLTRVCLQRFFKEELHRQPHERDYSLIAKGQQIALQGLVLAPTRAEFFCLIGDCLVQMGKERESLPFYSAAKSCLKPTGQETGFLFVNHAAYEYVPRNAIAGIKFKMGDLDGAILEAKENLKLYNNEQTKELLTTFLNLKTKIDDHDNKEKIGTDEIIISCLPGQHPYPFDEEIYENQGVGGSETALIEVAKHLTKKTGRRVIVFNNREGKKICKSRVEYRPSQEMYEYFTKYLPDMHIAWRHNVKLTDAPTYLWCHDLFTPGAENHKHYDLHICLSEFHKNYVMSNQNIPGEKIILTRNGVNKDRFSESVKKNENKIIWPNSPDRGLERAIEIMDIARKTRPDLELHVFYGLDNLYKYGMAQRADELKSMMAVRPWIKYVGNVDQKRLAREMQESAVWLYPANFIESYCITAIEALYAKCFPLARELGALKDTLKEAHDKGMARLLYLNAETQEQKEAWAKELLYILDNKLWEKIDISDKDYSWEGVADDFIAFSPLLPLPTDASVYL